MGLAGCSGTPWRGWGRQWAHQGRGRRNQRCQCGSRAGAPQSPHHACPAQRT
uniref:Uncharacterized protein n=1 Tax=Anguilla anguilla TaxID=7936 RepID=A0A0E9W2M6_ANGAN